MGGRTKYTSLITILLVLFAITLAAHGQENSVTFDNRSGEPALVKLIGPTYKEVQVPNGAKRSIKALAGSYHVKVRYGTAGKYRYTKGQEFQVIQTATTRSETMITLHEVIGGNYESHPISEQGFNDSRRPTKHATRKAHSYWARDDGSYVALQLELKGGHYAYMMIPEPRFRADMYHVDYRFPGDVKTSNEIEAGGRNWPAGLEVYRAACRWYLDEKRTINGISCSKVESIATEVSELGKVLGYHEGETIGPPYWAQVPGTTAETPKYVAPYASHSISHRGRSDPVEEKSVPREKWATDRAGEPRERTGKFVRFAKWGISFEYPTDWSQYPADRVRMMENHLAAELRPYDRELLEFAMISSLDNEIVLLLSKYRTPKTLKPAELVAERQKVYQDAKRAGDVTKINYVKETTLSQLPAVEEDVERSNGARGRTHKVVNGNVIFELSFVVSNKKRFALWSDVLKHVISTLAVEREAGKHPRRNAHTFASATLDVKVHGFRWLDPVVTWDAKEKTTLTARNGSKLIAFHCSFSLKGTRTEVKSPAEELQLLHDKKKCAVLGAYTGEPLMRISNLSALGCALTEPEIVFAVPDSATEHTLRIDAGTGTPRAIATLPDLGKKAE